ncbi:hypothetical protein HanXRQr2_Chr16g0756881 [Helianthus annuus]|uniref:Uncharacterized protein n=1 Tax=Helianthus annuus TaxID=4232 RepID=A0A9K3DSA8_HELAN|nr:hypothetical protein HanXRQr2_Chr16g0756881 [Helianthus annuus]KAJ0821881.1 hypothetical protein HanPSC8_Chr16g0725401 [Helianthus annuus]
MGRAGITICCMVPDCRCCTQYLIRWYIVYVDEKAVDQVVTRSKMEQKYCL